MAPGGPGPHNGLTMPPTPPSPARLRDLVRERAGELGLAAVGFTSASPVERERAALEQWLDRGFGEGLTYLTKKPADRANPQSLLPTAKTVISVALRLPPIPAQATAPGAGACLLGRVARFARYPSYHAAVGEKLAALAETLARSSGGVATRIAVDSAPLLERPLARRAGLGFVANSALLVVPGQGTQVVLGELLVDLELELDAPDDRRCRDCGACRKACPTGALVGPGLLDARRCVSHLTQHAGVVPRELRARLGAWVYGCDVCQSVCPENHTEATSRPKHGMVPADGLLPPDSARPEGRVLAEPDLVDLVWARGGGFRSLVGESRLGEARPSLLARNAVIALGNSAQNGDDRALRPLVQITQKHPSPNVRLHAAWALGNWPAARAELDRVAREDPDPAVRAEAEARLDAS